MKQYSLPHTLGKSPKDPHPQPSWLAHYIETASSSPSRVWAPQRQGLPHSHRSQGPAGQWSLLDVSGIRVASLLFWKVVGWGKQTDGGDQGATETWDSPLTILGFPRGSDGKESACSARDVGSIHGSGRSPGEGNGHPLQCSCPENSMDRGAWWATVHGVTKSWTWLRG